MAATNLGDIPAFALTGRGRRFAMAVPKELAREGEGFVDGGGATACAIGPRDPSALASQLAAASWGISPQIGKQANTRERIYGMGQFVVYPSISAMNQDKEKATVRSTRTIPTHEHPNRQKD